MKNALGCCNLGLTPHHTQLVELLWFFKSLSRSHVKFRRIEIIIYDRDRTFCASLILRDKPTRMDKALISVVHRGLSCLGELSAWYDHSRTSLSRTFAPSSPYLFAHISTPFVDQFLFLINRTYHLEFLEFCVLFDTIVRVEIDPGLMHRMSNVIDISSHLQFCLPLNISYTHVSHKHTSLSILREKF